MTFSGKPSTKFVEHVLAEARKNQRKGKVRHCWNCGADMGFIEDRYYDRSDTCGATECEREARWQEAAERAEAHERLDRDREWSV